ncbi:hypothetical protein CKM354_000673500 [Cercospora kikuchii]|uniref:BTB domain-containing protein n=1 Tax=Cercospora kikuchii TaxID=84275 RepID=A0A9P3CPP7_9PEZI|nr:uncharacterized protein CKM354_000673500 [Cercospora kikuchii]GIZ43510.1 hypothetical protein CKM354_000673500 [Cercospora kikuchii]
MAPASSLWTKARPVSAGPESVITVLLYQPSLIKTRRSHSPIAVHVGKSPGKTLYAFEATVRASSRFFDAALKKVWEEGRSREIHLPEHDPEIVKIYLNWVDIGELDYEDETDVERNESGVFYRLIHAFLLGDKLLAPDFKDAVTDAVASVYADGLWMPGKGLRQILYENTMPGATLRRMVIRQLSMGTPLAVMEDEPQSLLYDLSHELAEGKSKALRDFKKEVEDCIYHEHQAGAEHCYRNKRH